MKHRKSLSSFLLILLAVGIVNSVFVMQRVQAADGYPVADFIWYPASPAVGEWFICNISSLALNLEYPLVAFNWEIVGPATPMGPVNGGDLVLHADSVGWVTVTFTVWNTLGLSDTIQKSIYVQLVRADFTYSPDNPKVGQEIIFDASPSVGEIGPYIWNFDGEIESSNIKTTSHSFPSEGSYTVTLTVFSSSGTPFSKNLEVTVVEETVEKTVILLVHGFQCPLSLQDYIDWLFNVWSFDPVENWGKMAQYLARANIDNLELVPGQDFWKLEGTEVTVYISNYSHDNHNPTVFPIRYYAGNLAEEIQIIKNEEDVDKIDIVAHSMGGLVARAYIEDIDFGDDGYDLDYQYDVRNLIMLGTPNHGVDIATYFSYALNWDSVKDLKREPRSSFITTLNGGVTGDYQEVKYSTIAGNFLGLGHDLVVLVDSVELSEVPWFRSTVLPLYHSILCNRGSSILTVESLLKTGEVPNALHVLLGSPAEVRVYDSAGRVTGLVNGEIREEIPNSFYDDETILINSPVDSFYFEVYGIGTGTYSLALFFNNNGEEIMFNARYIPTIANALHQYSVDWQALSNGEEGVTVQIDADGDGVFEDVITADSDLTEAELMLRTETVIDVDPDTLYLGSNIRWITAYIELPDGYDYNASMIDVASLQLNGLIPAEAKPTAIGDYNENGVLDLMVKFSGSDAQAILSVGEVELTISGNLLDGRKLEGIGTIKVIHPNM